MSEHREAVFVTKFTGDFTEIQASIEEYLRSMADLEDKTSHFSSEVVTSLRMVNGAWQANVNNVVIGTERQIDSVGKLAQSFTGVSDEVKKMMMPSGVASFEKTFENVPATFKDMGLAVSATAGSFANFGHIIANLQMPMIWMQWREEQLMVTTRRIRELTETYTTSLKENGPAADRTRKALSMLNEEKKLAAVYTQRMERAELMMNLAYLTTIADIFPAAVRLYDSLNSLKKLSTIITTAETAATWLEVHAKAALVIVKSALLPYMVPLMIAGATAAGVALTYLATPKSAKGQEGGKARIGGWAEIEPGEGLVKPEYMRVMERYLSTFKGGNTQLQAESSGTVNISINVTGGGDSRTTANAITQAIDNYFSHKYYSRGMRPI